MAAKAGKKGRIVAQSSGKKKPKGRSPITSERNTTIQKQTEAKLAHLASFPELNPNPIVEVDLAGHLYYCNPAAKQLFPDLQTRGLQHPWLKDLKAIVKMLKQTRKRSYTRELKIGDLWYHQSIIPVLEGKRLRIYGLDITEHKQAEEALRSGEERYRGLYEAISGGVIMQDRKGAILGANAAARSILGLTEDEIQARTLQDPRWRAIREDGSPLPADDRPSMRALRTGIANQGTVMGVFNPSLDQYRWILVNAEPILDPKTSQVQAVVTTFLDITERKKREEERRRLNRTLTALSNGSKAMTHAGDESGYMEEVCKVIVEDCGHKMVWIGFVEEDEGKTVRPVAYAGFEEGYLETLGITWADTERGRGPTGTSIRTGKASMCRNMLTDPAFAPWREQARKRGYASSVALPLMGENKAFGAITIYSQEPDPFSADEVKLLSELADDLAYGIRMLRLRAAHEQAEEAVQTTLRRFYTVLASMYTGLLLVTDESRVEFANQAFCGLFDLNDSPTDLVGLTASEIFAKIGKAYLYPDEAITHIKEIVDRGQPVKGEEVTMRGGRELLRDFIPIHIKGKSYGRLWYHTDITERKQAEEALRKAHDELETRVAERTTELRNVVEALQDEMAERAQAEEAYRRAASHGRSLIEASLDPLVTISAEGKVTDVNRATELITGLSRDQLIGSDFTDYFTEPNKARTGYQRVFSDGSVRDYPLAIRDTKGHITEVLYNATVYKNEAGEVQGVFAAARDITERKKAEEALRGASLYTRSLIEASLDPLVTISAEGKVTDVNRATELITGLSRDQLIGSDFSDYFTEPDKARAGYQQVFKEGSVRDYPLAIRHAAGHITDVLYNATVYKNEAGEVQGAFAAARDITAQKSAEQERLRLIAAIEQSSESIVITDDAGEILYGNPAFSHINDYLPREALGKNYFDILTGDGRDKGFKKKLADILGKGRIWEDHFTRGKKDGTSYELDVTISPVRDQSGNITNYSIIERDVTRETILEQHLRQQQKMEALGTLAGGIAHDFNNILMPIMINTELSLYDAPAASPITQYLNTVLQAAQRGQELVKQIISFSRQKEQERSPIRITPVIKETLKFLKATAPQHIEIREHFDAESGMILADPTQIHQVLMNLCSNAVHAMREKGGVLEVSLADVEVDAYMLAKHLDLKPGPYLKLVVSDTGHGMDLEIVKRIFDPFFTTKKPGEGTGMGLAVVHGIVTRHEGAIITYSEPGKGSTFNIFFPRIEGDPGAETADQGAIPMGKERILFIDDEEVQARSGRHLLERLGYDVTTRTDSLEALEKFRAQPDAFDLVITDQSMPSMTGIQLAEKLMHIRPDIPIILCTGFSEVVDGKEAKAMGIREFMMKPFSARQLAETIRRILDGRD